MPKIKEYQQQVGGPQELPLAQVQRQAYASDFSGAGVGMSMLGKATEQGAHDLVNAYRLQEEAKAREEVTDAAVELARFNASAEHELKNAINSGAAEADSYTEEYMARISTNLDLVGAKYQTPAGRQAWAKGSEATRSHYLVKAGEAQAHMAGVKAVAGFKDFVANSGNILLSNPLDFERIEQNVNDVIHDPRGIYARIPADKKEELAFAAKTQLAQSAAQGVIRLDPRLGLEVLQQGKYDAYLTPDNKHALMNEARVGIAGLEAEARRQEAEAVRLRKKEIDSINQGFVEHYTNRTLTVPMILNSGLDAVGEGSKEHWVKMLEAQNKEHHEPPIRKDPAVFVKALQGIRDGTITKESQIEDIYIESANRGRGVTWEEAKQLRTELKDFRSEEGSKLGAELKEFEESVKSKLDKSNPLMGQIDRTGPAQRYAFHMMLMEKVKEYREAGKDPRALLDPKSPDFLGSDESLRPYQRTIQESMNEVSKALQRGQENKPPDNNTSPERFKWFKDGWNALFPGEQKLPESTSPAPGGKPPMAEPGMLDPNGPIVEPSMLDPNGPDVTPTKKGAAAPTSKQPLPAGMTEAERAARTTREEPIRVEPRRPDETPAQYLERWNKAHK